MHGERTDVGGEGRRSDPTQAEVRQVWVAEQSSRGRLVVGADHGGRRLHADTSAAAGRVGDEVLQRLRQRGA